MRIHIYIYIYIYVMHIYIYILKAVRPAGRGSGRGLRRAAFEGAAPSPGHAAAGRPPGIEYNII